MNKLTKKEKEIISMFYRGQIDPDKTYKTPDKFNDYQAYLDARDVRDSAIEWMETARENDYLKYFLCEEKQIQCKLHSILGLRDQSFKWFEKEEAEGKNRDIYRRNWDNLVFQVLREFLECIYEYDATLRTKIILIVEDDLKIAGMISKQLANIDIESVAIEKFDDFQDLYQKTNFERFSHIILDRELLYGEDAWEHLSGYENFCKKIILASANEQPHKLDDKVLYRLDKTEQNFFGRIVELVNVDLTV